MKHLVTIVALLAFVGVVGQINAQDYAPPPAPYGQTAQPGDLDQVTGPIALYPDPLIAQILPAATQPSQIAVAYSYVTQGGDPNLIDQQPWDTSVKALARYPDVLKMLNDNLQWTAELGQAFLSEPSDVMDSIQRLRAQAQDLGNLQTTPEETVTSDDGEIDIVPSNPEMIYVPVYDPGIIFFQRPYGRHFLTFGLGFRIGGWLDHDFDWHDHNVIVWGRDHPRPANWWREHPVQRRDVINRDHVNVWHPPAGVVHRPAPARGGLDRGYDHPPVQHPNPPRENNPGRNPHPEPRPIAPQPQPHPQPAPVHTAPVHVIPSRPTVSAFTGVQSAPDTRAASSRGVQSRQPSAPAPRAAPVSRPAPSPAPSHSAPPGGNGKR